MQHLWGSDSTRHSIQQIGQQEDITFGAVRHQGKFEQRTCQ